MCRGDFATAGKEGIVRTPIIAGNWKMNKTVEEALSLANGIKRTLYEVENVEIVLCPPFTSLGDIKDILLDTNIRFGAQNMHWEPEGAFTGEISSKMLTSVGCTYVIIGHSERRAYFGETNETVNKKVKAALAGGLCPIMCVGERLDERESGKAFDVIKEHVEKGLAGVSEDQMHSVVIAYEPVWAIGTGKNATPEQAGEVHAFIRTLLAKEYGAKVSEKTRVQYGGSVKPGNIESLMRMKDIDGALIGGVSLKVDAFVDTVKKAADVAKEK
jgi:triosephosphate isomerase